MATRKTNKQVDATIDTKNLDKGAQPANLKTENLAPHTADATGEAMTTNTGLKISDDQNSLKAGDRGATLLEDFILREKITHFDHERIPERVVHARGSGLTGYLNYTNRLLL